MKINGRTSGSGSRSRAFRNWLRLAQVSGAVAAILLMACSEGPTAPQPGNLRVFIKTTGGDQDLDGYELVIDAERRLVFAQNDDAFLQA